MATAAKILVVDDDPAIRLLCRVNLELEGYAVIEAGTLREARAALEVGNVDLLLLDMHVGNDRGSELMRELRDSESRVRIALLTGSAAVTSDVAGVADAVIGKPFELDELTAVVRRLLGASADSTIG